MFLSEAEDLFLEPVLEEFRRVDTSLNRLCIEARRTIVTEWKRAIAESGGGFGLALGWLMRRH